MPERTHTRPPCSIQFDFLKYGLFTAVACIMSKIVSPTPKNFSATERTVGSGMADASGLEEDMYELRRQDLGGRTDVKPLERLTPATTVESRTASIV